MAELIPPDLTVLDRAALSWFLLAWLGYGLANHAIPWGGSITARINDVRRAWMRTMVGRDNRIADVLCLAIRSVNAGIRGYLFALAVLTWLLGPLAFPLVTTGMMLMLLLRQFGSATAVAIRHSHAALVGARPAPHPAAGRPGAHSAAGVNGPGRAVAMRMRP